MHHFSTPHFPRARCPDRAPCFCRGHLGNLLKERGKLQEAEALLRRVLRALVQREAPETRTLKEVGVGFCVSRLGRV